MLHYLGDDHPDQFSHLSLDLWHYLVPHAWYRTWCDPMDIKDDAYKSCVPIVNFGTWSMLALWIG